MKIWKNRNKIISAIFAMILAFACIMQYGYMTYNYIYAISSGTVKSTSLNVRSGAGTSYSKLGTLVKGQKVSIVSETTGSDGNIWYSVNYTDSSGSIKSGYVSKAYIKTSANYTSDASFESYMNSQGFPDSYKSYLREMHAEYPNWIFNAEKINIDWSTVIENESIVGRNLVSKDSKSSWKSTATGAYDWNTSSWPGFDSSSWVAASEDIIKYYMDPRNFLDTTYVFQFLTQHYDANTQNVDGVKTMIKGTFMENASVAADSSTDSSSTGSYNISPGATSGPGSSYVISNYSTGDSNVSLTAPGAESNNTKSISQSDSNYGPGMIGNSNNNSSTSNISTSGGTNYADIIMNAASQSGVNPYVIAAMIIQEQGTKGTSGLISGNTSPYQGIYNYFNIEAYQSGSTSAVQRGLWWASQSGSYGRPWSSVEKAIVGGAQYYGDNYVSAGQNTFYLKKFNVQGDNIYKHQYMTNIEGAAAEGAKLSIAYNEDIKKSALEFRIPVYNNMPDDISPCPTGDGSPNNKLSNLYIEGFSLTPSFDKDIEKYDLIVDSSITNVIVGASAISDKASMTGCGNIELSEGTTRISIEVKAENGSVRTYIVDVVRQSGGAISNNAQQSTTAPGSSQSQSSQSSSNSGPSGYTTVELVGPGGQR